MSVPSPTARVRVSGQVALLCALSRESYLSASCRREEHVSE